MVEPKPIRDDHFSIEDIPRYTVMLVAELARYALRGGIVLKHFGDGRYRSKFLEGKVQEGAARLGAEALAVKLQTEP